MRLKLHHKQLNIPVTVTESTALYGLAVIVGLASCLCVLVFREAIVWFHEIFAIGLAHDVLGGILGAGGIVVSLALAGAIVGLLMEHLVGEERHHGVAGIMEAVALAGGRLRYWRIPFKSVASALSLGAGASVGPEDPSVQVGSNLGSMFGQKLHLSEDVVRLLVAAGAAAAIATAFKAPIAGIFFALEVILIGSFETRSIGIIILSAVAASALTQAIEPGYEMGPFTYTLGHPMEVVLFVPLGLLLAPVSVLFVRALYWQHDLWHKVVHLPRPAKTALAGVLVGLVGIFLPQIMGPGRETMNEILSHEDGLTLFMLLALGVAKIVMTSVSMAGGFVGGIFAPSLFVGTMFGAAYGIVADTLLGNQAGITDPPAYAIAGMAATMAGVVRAPITAIMMVFELTNDYRMILPIMLATMVCVALAERYEPSGIYTLGLLRKGVRLAQGREIDLMQVVTVGDAMIKPAPTISENASLAELRDALRKYKSLSLCVVDADGLLSGIVTLSDLQRAFDLRQPEANQSPQTVGDICTREVMTVSPEDTVWMAIRKLSAYDVGRLPVLKPGTREVIGLIGRHGVVRAYNIAIQRKLQDQHTAERIRLHTLTGAHVYEFHIQPESPLSGKYIREVVWPSECAVASIQRNGKLIVPHGQIEIKSNDLLTIVANPAVEDELETIIKQGRFKLPAEKLESPEPPQIPTST